MTWLDLLRSEVKATSMAKAAARLGSNRTAVSLCLAGKYPANTRYIEAKVLETLGQDRFCPALCESISAKACMACRDRPIPLNNPVEMRTWRICQQCPHNPSVSPPDDTSATPSKDTNAQSPEADHGQQ